MKGAWIEVPSKTGRRSFKWVGDDWDFRINPDGTQSMPLHVLEKLRNCSRES
jgi:hypothetical protein